MSDVASIVTPLGVAAPPAAHAARNPRVKRSWSGRTLIVLSFPRRCIEKPLVALSIVTEAVSQRSTAIPTQSKPDPRLLELAGTRTRAVMRSPARAPGLRRLE